MDRKDVYQTVTDKIVAQLETGVKPWAPDWIGAGDFDPLPVRANGERYKGINVLMLWGAMAERGYQNNRFMTFKQAQALGACVRKGERGHLVTYAGTLTPKPGEGEGQDDAEGEARRFFLKGYTVFNVEQIDGLGLEWFAVPPLPVDGPARDLAAEAFFAGVGADIRQGGGRAFFQRQGDFIQVPPIAAFPSAESYYATLGHECIHWTGHKPRLDREFGKRFGDAAYSAEELTAELGAAFLCASLGLSAEPREDHAQYLAGFLKLLKADKRAIFTAASAAQKAADYLHGLADKSAGYAVAA